MNIKVMYIKLILKFRNAFRGVAIAFKTQRSFKIHIIAAGIIYILGILSSFSVIEWSLINTAILFVIVSELFNTAIEHICNFIQPKYDKKIKIIKDISAGAVLIAVINAIVIGNLAFLPRIMEIINVQ